MAEDRSWVNTILLWGNRFNLGLPQTEDGLRGLKSIDCSNRDMTYIPDEIYYLENLTSMDLRYNQLTSIPTSIKYLTNLTGLYLYSNQLTSIPIELIYLTKLTSFYFDRDSNQIGLLKEIFAKWKEERTQISSLEQELASYKAKTSLLETENSQLKNENQDITDRLNLYSDFSKSKFNTFNILPVNRSYPLVLEFIYDILNKIDFVSNKFINEINVATQIQSKFKDISNKLLLFNNGISKIIENTDFSFSDLRKQLIGLKEEVESQILIVENSYFTKLSQFQSSTYFDFKLFAEVIESSYNKKVAKLENFAILSSEYQNIEKFIKDLISENDIFTTTKKVKFLENAIDESIDEVRANEIIDEWQEIRNQYDENSAKFLQLYLDNKIDSNLLFAILNAITKHRDLIGDFYETNRVSLVHKNYMYAKYKLLETSDLNLEIYPILKQLEQEIFSVLSEKQNKLPKSSNNNQIDQRNIIIVLDDNRKNFLSNNISTFGSQISSELATNIKNSFQTLSEEILQTVRIDAEQYSREYQKIDNEYNRLMFKMLQDLKKERI